MKNKLLTKIFVTGCVIALLLTGCGKEINGTDTLAGTAAETTGDAPSDTTVIEETIEEESEKESEPSEEDSEDAADEDTQELVEASDEESDEGKEEEDISDDSEEATDDSSQNDSTSDTSESNNTGSSSNENASSDDSSSESSNSSGTGNTSTENSGADSSNSSTDSGNTSTNIPHTHSYDNGVIAMYANCVSTGVKLFTCSCGDTYTETIPVTAHTYSNGLCTVCGTADPNYVVTYTYDVYLETGMLDLTNARRNSLGCGSLTWDSSMDEAAKRRARELADWFGHTGGAGGTELITGGGGSIGLSSLHNNYINSPGHDNELHRNNYAYFSSATCVVKDSNGNITATYNVIILRSAQSEGASSQNMENSGIIDPNPPSDDEIIW